MCLSLFDELELRYRIVFAVINRVNKCFRRRAKERKKSNLSSRIDKERTRQRNEEKEIARKERKKRRRINQH
jgi:hypothetical protein